MRIGVGAQLLSYPRARVGGVGTYLRGILSALPAAVHERGHELHVYWGNDGPALIHELGLKPNGVHHHFSRFPLSRPQVRLPWEQVVLPLTARQDRLDVFHFLDHVMSVVPPAPRTVVTMHDAIPIRMPETYGALRGPYKGLMTRLSARMASRIILSSRSTGDDLVLLLGVQEQRTRVVYLGLNKAFRPTRDATALAAVRAKYGLPARFLVYVGRLEPRKNVDGLLRAYALARKRFEVQIPLVLAGKTSWMYENTLLLPQKLGIAQHVFVVVDNMPVTDLVALYSMAEALVFPTLYEGFGLPVLEAMACGTPVVASAVSSVPELVGDVGLLVNPLSTDEIAAAIYRILADQALRARLIEAGPQRASQFTWERAARETVAVYEEAATC